MKGKYETTDAKRTREATTELFHKPWRLFSSLASHPPELITHSKRVLFTNHLTLGGAQAQYVAGVKREVGG